MTPVEKRKSPKQIAKKLCLAGDASAGGGTVEKAADT